MLYYPLHYKIIYKSWGFEKDKLIVR
jgi:hypothetical protein